MKKSLEKKKYFILDMDGTFYLGDQLLEGSLEFLERVKDAGKDFCSLPTTLQKTGRFILRSWRI